MIGTNFPVSEYYKNHILDAETIVKKGKWWTAVLLLEDPNSGKKLINIYRWQSTGSGWKTNKRFTFRKESDVKDIFETIQKFSKHLDL